MSKPLLERLERRTIRMPNGCWVWTGRCDPYGRIWVGSRTDGTRRVRRVHVVAYELLVGPVPEGLELDHTCREPACWNPGHLEPVTHAENARRGDAGQHLAQKTHCPQGHPYDDANTYVDPSGRRQCRTCRRKRRTPGSTA